MAVSRKDKQGTRQDAVRRERPGAGRSHDRPGVALACTECSTVNRPLPPHPSSFSLALALELPQQSPRENHRLDETYCNAKGDINRDYRNLAITPHNPNKRTAPPIIAATITTFLLSNSSAITPPIHSYSASTLSTHEMRRAREALSRSAQSLDRP